MKKRSIILFNLILTLFTLFAQWIVIYHDILSLVLSGRGFVITDYKFWWFGASIPEEGGGFVYGFWILDLAAIMLTILLLTNIILWIKEKE